MAVLSRFIIYLNTSPTTLRPNLRWGHRFAPMQQRT